ncbi:MAG TPA: hypothetical protein VHW72_13165 [Candidatus Angelobacter sp.]|jgi:hypothetical protein|nr:hypothetical protein [Candidatus Angelobacter sp.]
MKSLRFAVALVFVIVMAGCRAHVVKISLTNTSTEPIKTIIVDYPDATFGKDTLAPHETYFSLVKPVDKGPIKVRFTDAQGGNHAYESISLQQGDEGSVNIKLTQTSAETGYDLARLGKK